MHVRKQKHVTPRRRFPARSHVILTAVQGRSLDSARDDDGAKRYLNAAALPHFMRRTLTSHSSLDSEVALHASYLENAILVTGD